MKGMPVATLWLAALLWPGTSVLAQGGFSIPNPLVLPDATGQLSTYTTNGSIDTTNPFFQNLGTNGRTCNSCHRPENAWAISPSSLLARFNATAGAAQAADGARDKAKARAYSIQLLEIAGNAETSRPELEWARAYLGGK